MRRIEFTIPGRPVRWQRPGEGTLPDGTTYRYTDPHAREHKKLVAFEARRAFGLTRPFIGPVVLRVVAIFGIPGSWPPKLRKAAQEARVMHSQDPDLSQLVKQIEDALIGIAYVDDNQVCGYPNSAKRYGYPERTIVTVEKLAQRPDEITPGQRRLEKELGQLGWEEILEPPARRRRG